MYDARGVIHACTSLHGTVLLRRLKRAFSFATFVNACRVGVFVLNLCVRRFKFPGDNRTNLFFENANFSSRSQS